MKSKLSQNEIQPKKSVRVDHNVESVKLSKRISSQQKLQIEDGKHSYIVDWQISNKTTQKKAHIKAD